MDDLTMLLEQQAQAKNHQKINHLGKKGGLREPEKKMYSIQFIFLKKFQRDLQEIQFNIQNLLNILTSLKQDGKKRLPYNIFKNFQKVIKTMKNVKVNLIEDNKKYAVQLNEREKLKITKSQTFHAYLSSLNTKKKQLKQYISALQTRVQNLQKNGYAQYVQFYAIIAEQPTIRFSFAEKTLLMLVQNRAYLNLEIKKQFLRAQQLQKQLIRENNKNKLSQKIEKKQNKEQNRIILINNFNSKIFGLSQKSKCDVKLKKIILLEQIKLFFINQVFLTEIKMRNKQKMVAKKIEIQKLKSGLKLLEEKVEFQKRKNTIEENISTGLGEGINKTDYFIYIKEVKKEISNKINQKFFMYQNDNLSYKRAKSK